MNRTKVDWLGFRTRAEVVPTVEALKEAYGQHLGEALDIRSRQSGYRGYEQSADVCIGGMRVGLLAFGGEGQKGWIMASMSGRGCEWVSDWDRAQEALAALPEFQFRRVDIAYDSRDGSVTHGRVVDGYRAGLFSTRGRPPSMKRIEPEDPCEGRTVYVGSREQGKYFRGYEKGYELAKGFPLGEVTHIDGVPIADIYRCEVEFKPKTAALPLDLIDRRDQYFAGAYPFLEHLLKVEPEILVQRRERGPQLDLQARLAQIRYQHGNALFTALMAYHGDLTAVWDRIVGKRHSDTLVQAGVLLVDHD